MLESDPLIADLDVIDVNEYIGWYQGVPADLDLTSWTNPYDKPVIISEFGGDARQGLHGDPSQRWTEEYQEDIYKHQIAALRKVPFIRAIAPWVLKDFRSRRRQLPSAQDGFNRKGLISNVGEKKKAYFVLQQFYREVTRGNGPQSAKAAAEGRLQAKLIAYLHRRCVVYCGHQTMRETRVRSETHLNLVSCR